MVCKLQKRGDEHALILDRATVDALGIDEDTPLEVEVDDHTLRVRASTVGVGRDRVEASIRKLRPRYERMLQRLAE